MFIRSEWVKNTQFEDLEGAKVLEKVLHQVESVKAQGKLPIVVFDLDSTLFDVSKRSYEILREWLTHPETESFKETRELLKTLHPSDMQYSLEDVWNKKGVSFEKHPFDHHFKHAKQFWRKRFFSSHYIHHDEPTPGAIDFVKKVYELGAKVVYLTGRDVPLMAFGTYDQLHQHGLPIEVERTRLILKPKRHMDDLDFKSGVAKLLGEWGTVVATFENEPKNLIAMAGAFPKETLNIFIETVSSDHPAPPGKSLYRIREFRL